MEAYEKFVKGLQNGSSKLQNKDLAQSVDILKYFERAKIDLVKEISDKLSQKKVFEILVSTKRILI